MTLDICFLVLAHVRHVQQNFAHLPDHVSRFYGNCQTMSLLV